MAISTIAIPCAVCVEGLNGKSASQLAIATRTKSVGFSDNDRLTLIQTEGPHLYNYNHSRDRDSRLLTKLSFVSPPLVVPMFTFH